MDGGAHQCHKLLGSGTQPHVCGEEALFLHTPLFATQLTAVSNLQCFWCIKDDPLCRWRGQRSAWTLQQRVISCIWPLCRLWAGFPPLSHGEPAWMWPELQLLLPINTRLQMACMCIMCWHACRWAVNILSMTIAALLGEWLCLRRELQDIPIGAPAALLMGPTMPEGDFL